MPRYLICMPLYSLKHRVKVQINSKALLSKAMLITQQHRYSFKKTFPSSFSSAFLSASKYICNLIPISGHFPRVRSCSLFLQLRGTKCMHMKCNEHFPSREQKLLSGLFSLAGEFHKPATVCFYTKWSWEKKYLGLIFY